MKELVNIVLLHAAAGQSEPLGEALAELLVASRQEPGCVLCELHQSRDDGATWMVYERWRGQEALEVHMKQPHVARFLARLGALVSAAPEVRAYDYRG